VGPLLEIVEGPDAGARARLSASFVIGRDPGLELTLTDAQVSRRHARLTIDRDRILVEDLNSSNGTFVNGNPVQARTRLKVGDELVLGASVLHVLGSDGAATVTSAVRPVPPALAIPEGRPDFVERLVDDAPPPAPPNPALESLVDARVRAQARLAPLAVLALTVLVIVVFLATK
jgi:pSer/pThr/pTyr-binding forkhead associated (FHA) protein